MIPQTLIIERQNIFPELDQIVNFITRPMEN